MDDPGLPLVGLIKDGQATDLALADAAARSVGLPTRCVSISDPVTDDLAGLVVDVSPEIRAEMLQRLADVWAGPILVEAPVAATQEELRGLAAVGDRLVSVNPLLYGLHTHRLIEELRAAGDQLETFTIGWRFRGPNLPRDALPRIIDYLAEVYPVPVERVAASSRHSPQVQVVSVRYVDGVLGSIEVGAHLAPGFPSASELVVECFGRSHVFHCAPGNQAVSVYDATRELAVDWQPETATSIVSAFAKSLRDGARPIGGIVRDLASIRLVDAIVESATTRRVVRLIPSEPGFVK